MNKPLILILIFCLFSHCSFNKNSSLWNEKEKIINESKNLKKIIVKNKKEYKELNPFLNLNLPKNLKLDKNLKNLNNFGSLKYNGYLDKTSSYRFSKFKNFNKSYFEPLILDDGLIFFNKKGDIFRLNRNKKILWKKNYYSKAEKKLNPILTFFVADKNLIIADNISKILLLDKNSGDLIWIKKSIYPFYSEIKVHKDKFFVIDYKNTLRCFYLKDGSECWNVKTEESFIVSNSKFSLITKGNLVIFNNSIGDITAVDISSGLIKWQLPTQKSTIINETFDFDYSKLVSDGNSIYFSNNRDQFYSIDLITGTINWINEISSTFLPLIIEDYIFTVSEKGNFFTLQKSSGNIIRINNLYKNYDIKKKKYLKPSGFVIGNNKLYLSNSDGSLIVVDLNSGKILKIEKITKGLISKPIIHKEKLFIVKNGSIIQYN